MADKTPSSCLHHPHPHLPLYSTDLTEGVRATARSLVSAEEGIRQAGHAAGRAMSEHVLPQARGEALAVRAAVVGMGT